VAVLTTEKDAVRLPAGALNGLPIAAVPVTVTIEPPEFSDWLAERLRHAGRAGDRDTDHRSPDHR
jgi:hypothetical protein